MYILSVNNYESRSKADINVNEGQGTIQKSNIRNNFDLRAVIHIHFQTIVAIVRTYHSFLVTEVVEDVKVEYL